MLLTTNVSRAIKRNRPLRMPTVTGMPMLVGRTGAFFLWRSRPTKRIARKYFINQGVTSSDEKSAMPNDNAIVNPVITSQPSNELNFPTN
jgi:hypothetical protein